ncbi:hypothetical protein DSD19_04595 [Rhodovulum sp. BSW8]|uniref:hypothetical protein n=1 Tax=Rhodovulum sp. BSW8 TaxID=2259645 RepID=UPI000DE423E3|nr:hypothetical protein [Rhodovulum sp. BSW8]RBO54659.1 hypothetical protein DSD19_04595 [Rhodovulum sp. BSW8]
MENQRTTSLTIRRHGNGGYSVTPVSASDESRACSTFAEAVDAIADAFGLGVVHTSDERDNYDAFLEIYVYGAKAAEPEAAKQACDCGICAGARDMDEEECAEAQAPDRPPRPEEMPLSEHFQMVLKSGVDADETFKAFVKRLTNCEEKTDA